MFNNHIKISIRQLRKQKFFTLINMSGLALSVMSCLLIFIYIRHELSYDLHYPNAANLYRVNFDIDMDHHQGLGVCTPPQLGPSLESDIPEIIKVGHLTPYYRGAGSNLVKRVNDQVSSYQEGFVFADQSFSELFGFKEVAGNPQSWLTEPNSIVITQKAADKFYPNNTALGKKLILNNDPERSFVITGVIENLPENMHFNYDYFISLPTIPERDRQSWLFNNYFTYTLFQDGVQPKNLKSKFDAFKIKHFSPVFMDAVNLDLAEVLGKGKKFDILFQPVTEIHLQSQGFGPQLAQNGDINHVRMFSIIGFFLLLIAVFNFINLSTARSAHRAREIGVRKVLGSFRHQLVSQFLMESVLICLASFGIGLLLTQIALPYFNQIAGRELIVPFGQWFFLPTLIGAMLITGLLAGIYPALYLSGFEPIKVLKGKLKLGSHSSGLRKGLVVAQFVISSALIIATLVVFNQMQFIQNKKIGFEKDQVLLLHDTYTIPNKLETLKTAMKQLPEVEQAAISSFLPLDGGARNSILFYEEGKKDNTELQIPMQTWQVDEDYLQTLGIKLKEGRFFSKDRITDSTAVVLNETAIEKMKMKDPLGKKISSPFLDDDYTIIGVVEDFNFENLKTEVDGLGFFYGGSTGTMALKVSSKNWDQTITKIETTWQQFAPSQALRYSFLDERFDRMYKSESRAATLFNIFTFLAIFIACLGLFGLATFTAEQRTKEIGIRKVLGASVGGIVALLSKDFLQLVLIALIIATPLAWYFMDQWLQNFVYHIQISWWMFLLAGISALLIAFFTVSFQSIRAALANPVESLKNE